MPRGKNREKLIASGLELFHHQGFGATGVQEIADGAGVPKGSFYNYFESKEAFGLAVLEEYSSGACAELQAALADHNGPALERLRRFVETASSAFSDPSGGQGARSGCMAGNLAQEMASQSPVFRDALDRAFDCMQQYFFRCLEEARDAGELSESWDVDQLAEYIYNGWHGAVLRAKASRDDRALQAFVNVTFDGLLV